MFIDLTKDEKAILKMIAGESMPHIRPGAGVWTHLEYLRNVRLIQRASPSRYATTVSYELSREGKTYLRRNP